MVKLALLWHMHQPYYQDLSTGEHILPWVRLHAIKDYWGMVALLREFPGVHVTFNLVPSLLLQIEAFAADRAHDRHLAIGLKEAASLDAGERRFLVAEGFHAPYERMIAPYARYAELHARRSAPEAFTADDLRDLQVLHKLAWMDPDWLLLDTRLRRLVEKSRGYSEADKRVLREVELELLNAVIPAYRDAAATGRIELSTSPFYHPILPLLCDTDVHFRAHPASALPPGLFARPSDAALQLDRAFAYHERLFGASPCGVWPSEGSVSEAVVALLGERGCVWTATDEEILARTLRRPLSASDLYRPYRLTASGAPPVIGLFRDHQMSDAIGFVYQSWSADTAAADFLERVREAGRRFAREASGEVATVTVILDGENAWEHYDGGGRPFLRALYRELQSAHDIQTVSMSEAAAGPARLLPSIFPGSWINGDFYIWAGHRDDHRAWAQLAAARATFEEARESVSAAAREAALEELLIAEGSDWFWWYGDDHSSSHDREFDELFRRHVRNVYRALGRGIPDELHRTNITTAPVTEGRLTLGLLATPVLDGRTDFGGWAGAAEVPLAEGGGAMHRVAGGQLLKGLRITADADTLYFRLSGPGLGIRLSRGELRLDLLVDRPERRRVELEVHRSTAENVSDASVRFERLGVAAGGDVSWSLLVSNPAGQLIEQHPIGEPITVRVPTVDHDAARWLV